MTAAAEPQADKTTTDQTAGPPALRTASGVEKAAILLVTLGEQASAHVVKHLTDEELRMVTRAIAQLRVVSPQQSEQVLEEFYQATVARDFPHRGGADYAKRVLTSAFGREDSGRIMGELDLGNERSHAAEPLRQADPVQLAALIKGEHPQTIAIILAHLSQSNAAALLDSLPKPLQSDVVMRISSLDQVSPDVIRKIAAVLSERIKSVGEVKRESLGGARYVAEILNQMDSTKADEILAEIRDQHEAIEQGIRHYMFVFDDLMLLDTKAIKEIVGKIDRKLLVLGLKGTSDQLRDHVLSCMSTRGADMVREDMDALGPVKIRDVEGAQQQIIAVVRMLEADGILSLKGGGDDQYVA